MAILASMRSDGSLIRNECNKLRRFEPIPRPFVVHVHYPNSYRLFTAWKGAIRSVNEWVVAIGVARIKLIGLPEGVQCVRKGYNRSGWEGEISITRKWVISETTVTTPGNNVGPRWKREAVSVRFDATYSIAAELSSYSSHFYQKVTIMTGKNNNTLHTVTIETGTGMVMVEGQGLIGDTAPGVIYSCDHWFRCAVFIPWSHRIEINRRIDVVIQIASLVRTVRLTTISIPIPMVIAGS
jgi:hypothetical protein